MIIFQMKAAVTHLRRADPVMAGIIQRVGPCELMVLNPCFETLARSITFQQLHGKAASTIFGRVQKVVGRSFTATAFLKADEEALRRCGLSRQKMASLTDLAEHVVGRKINFKKLAELENEAVLEMLTQVRGVGVWTAQMFMMFALQRPNVLPVGDFGIRNAVRKAYGLKDLPKPAELHRIAEPWHPYCTVASWYLWRSMDGIADLSAKGANARRETMIEASALSAARLTSRPFCARFVSS
jgi:DNA-3-methyladenine glycosylase II